jgi:hypothetical protein
MPTYLSPGVYVEEVEAGSRPIEGVGTAVAAFVGLAADGPFNTPTLVSNWSQFTKQFGEFVPGSYLAHAVFGYFANGGGNCYVVRVGEDGAKGDGKKELPPSAHAALGGYRVRAIDGGAKGNDITVEVADAGGQAPSDDAFKLEVKRDGKTVERRSTASPPSAAGRTWSPWSTPSPR